MDFEEAEWRRDRFAERIAWIKAILARPIRMGQVSWPLDGRLPPERAIDVLLRQCGHPEFGSYPDERFPQQGGSER